MTGFARQDGAHEGWRWAWELKSVNGRGLEMRFRLPPGFEAIEPALRAAVTERFKRGSVFASLQLDADAARSHMRVNETALAGALAALQAISEKLPNPAPPSAADVLSLRGVWEQADDAEDDAVLEARNSAIIASFAAGLDALAAVRANEGAAMAGVIAGHVDEIETLTKKADATAAATLGAIRDRIAAQLNELLAGGPIPEERVAQEAAVMAIKADVREELNRLAAHVEAARALLARGGAIGRELDFLTQELNRETNTLCAKAQDMSLKQTGLDLKKTVDQLREQVQNVE